jgi:hypothetical protein
MSLLLFNIATVYTINELISCVNHYDLYNNKVTFLTHDVGGMYKSVPLNAVRRGYCMLVRSTLALSIRTCQTGRQPTTRASLTVP